jgi:predicted acetyltransferase
MLDAKETRPAVELSTTYSACDASIIPCLEDTSPNVTLIDTIEGPSAQAFFLRAWPMYLHELAVLGADSFKLDESGKWFPNVAPAWVATITPNIHLYSAQSALDERQPFMRTHVIAVDGVAAGFACVAARPFRYMPEDCDHCIGEFFLVHNQRGAGVGQRAFELLLASYPRGSWYLRTAVRNTRAMRFWAKCLSEPHIQLVEDESDAKHRSYRFNLRRRRAQRGARSTRPGELVAATAMMPTELYGSDGSVAY